MFGQSFLAVICTTLLVASASAEQVRYRYVPVDASGAVKQVPAGPMGAPGEQLKGLGFRPQPYTRVFRPNQMVTFRHPYTGRNVTVPLTLPDSTPQMQTRSDRIVYSYGTYQVEARFLRDGAVDIVYNSGFLQLLSVE